MGTLRKIVYISGLCLAMLFAFAGQANPVAYPITEKQESVFSGESVHCDDFLQPQNPHHLVGSAKSEQHPVVKFFALIKGFDLQIGQSKAVFTYHFQDINRCEKVSLHLFPYHFFW